MLEARKRAYREAGVSYYRPWVFLITDGAPTDSWSECRRQSASAEGDSRQARKSFSFFAVGVEGADMQHPGTEICSPDRPPLKLKGLSFRELFTWLSSSSLGGVAKSQPGQSRPPAIAHDRLGIGRLTLRAWRTAYMRRQSAPSHVRNGTPNARTHGCLRADPGRGGRRDPHRLRSRRRRLRPALGARARELAVASFQSGTSPPPP